MASAGCKNAHMMVVSATRSIIFLELKKKTLVKLENAIPQQKNIIANIIIIIIIIIRDNKRRTLKRSELTYLL